MKLLIIGIDGATFDLIKPWVEEGKLPNIKRLMEEGVYGEMQTIHPPLTGPAWVSLTTGVNPGKHGVFDFMSSSTDKIEFINSQGVKVARVWEILSDHRKKVGVISVPVTYPPLPVNGFVISGFLGVKKASYPPQLIEEIEEATGKEYRVEVKQGPYGGKEKQYIKERIDIFEAKKEIILYLLQNKSWDFFMIVFGIADSFSHFFWEHMESGGEFEDIILKAYSLVDVAIGDFLKHIDKQTNVMLVSDHGFGRLRKMVNFNNYLAQKGYLHFKTSARLKIFLFQKGLTPNRIFGFLNKLGVAGLARQIPQDRRNRLLGTMLSYKDLDWGKTVAYSKGHVGQIHINRDGLDARGLVYEEVLKQLVEDLYELRDPDTQERIVKRVFTKDEIYSGKYKDEGPDIVLLMEDYIAYPLFAGDSRVVTEHILKGRSGTHRMNGIFLGWGPYFEEKGEKKGLNITDVVPTVLDIFDLPISEYMDGKPVGGIPKAVERTPAKDIYLEREEKTLKPEEEEELKRRLQALGYLD